MSAIDRTADSDEAFAARTVFIDAADNAPESWAATVERVARAICAADADSDGTAWTWRDTAIAVQNDYRRMAEAALRAANEPLDAP